MSKSKKQDKHLKKISKDNIVSQERFLEKCSEAHGDRYNYSKAIYKGSSKKVEIICMDHGSFYQRPNDHYTGQGCPMCRYEKSTFTYDGWLKNSVESKKFDSYKVYIIRVFNNEESFIKIGRTFTKISDRFGNGNNTFFPYNYEVIKIIEGSSKHIYDLEKKIHGTIKDFKYIPMISFNGKTECYSTDVLLKLKIHAKSVPIYLRR